MSGWTNYPGMVTSKQMIENEMGYRGSKSVFYLLGTSSHYTNTVKEQRVDGSYLGLYNKQLWPKLRCTLTDFERNYQIKIPSNYFKNRTFSTLNLNPDLNTFNINQSINPWFITGFTDAEGCFTIKIQPNAKLKTKWRVRPVFSITLHLKDLPLLKQIQNTLGVGKISKSSGKSVIYAVDSIKEIPVIIKHFDMYPLITQKCVDYSIFKQCFEIINRGEHLIEKGLSEIITLKSGMNLGLPDYLKFSFPNLIEKERPNYSFKGIPHPFWISGFTSGDGSFHIGVDNYNKNPRVFPRFGIHLHIRELEVLKGIYTYLYSNNWVENKTIEVKESDKKKKISILEKSVNFQITKFSDITNKIIPFFNQYPILGVKSLDFIDFKKVCNIIKTKEHLISLSVFNNILEIKSGMNQNRK